MGGTYFARSTFGPVEGRALLGLAEVRVVGVTAPQLLTRVERAELKDSKEKRLLGPCAETAEADAARRPFAADERHGKWIFKSRRGPKGCSVRRHPEGKTQRKSGRRHPSARWRLSTGAAKMEPRNAVAWKRPSFPGSAMLLDSTRCCDTSHLDEEIKYCHIDRLILKRVSLAIKPQLDGRAFSSSICMEKKNKDKKSRTLPAMDIDAALHSDSRSRRSTSEWMRKQPVQNDALAWDQTASRWPAVQPREGKLRAKSKADSADDRPFALAACSPSTLLPREGQRRPKGDSSCRSSSRACRYGRQTAQS